MGARERSAASTIQSNGAAPAAMLLVVAGEGHFATHRLVEGSTLLVGRDPDSEIKLVHPKISRRHAIIRVGRVVEVEDLGSTNGTRLAGRRLATGARTLLELGKSLQLGPFVAVVLESKGEATPEAPLRAAIPIADPTRAGVPEVVARVAAGKVSVLITGETGVGKEVLARTVHTLSGRPGQFVAINCASLSESLLESDLFGHERGSFTGAAATKPGLFEVAGGGTVFLDEIGELPAGLQARLLRVLETRSVYRVGGVKPVMLDIRFIAATHRSLVEEVAQGRFRRDLYFRVNGIMLAIAPLRMRREFIPVLARELLEKTVGPDRQAPAVSDGALNALLAHDWPGNVRELRTVMERAAVICNGEEIRAAHILLDASQGRAPDRPQVTPAPPARDTPALEREGPENGDERERIIAALASFAGNQTLTARKLGISRTTLVHKLALYRIPRPRKPPP